MCSIFPLIKSQCCSIPVENDYLMICLQVAFPELTNINLLVLPGQILNLKYPLQVSYKRFPDIEKNINSSNQVSMKFQDSNYSKKF